MQLICKVVKKKKKKKKKKKGLIYTNIKMCFNGHSTQAIIEC